MFFYMSGFCQTDSKCMISMPEMNLVFTGFDNLIQLAVIDKQMRKVKLECASCDKLQRIENTNQWVIRVDSVKPVLLQVKNKAGKVIDEMNIIVVDPPRPFIQLNSQFAFEDVTEIPNRISLKMYGPIPLSINYLIKKWSFKIGDELYEGIGSSISVQVQEELINFNQDWLQ